MLFTKFSFRTQQFTATGLSSSHMPVVGDALIQQTSGLSSVTGVAVNAGAIPKTVGQQQSVIMQDVDKQQGLIGQHVQQQNVTASVPTLVNVAASDSSQHLLAQTQNQAFTISAADQVGQLQTHLQSANAKQMPAAGFQQIPANANIVSLKDMSAEDQQRIKAEVEAGIMNQITVEQIRNLQAEAQVNILK